MTFTALHRFAGVNPGPIDGALLDAAIESGARETNDLDWKSKLPETGSLAQSDFPKDVAAMANSGGGVIVFGVKESDGIATNRVDVGDFTERHESALRKSVLTAIVPPVFGVAVHRLEDSDPRAVIVQVPASDDGPHLIFKNEMFGAPVRNHSDTEWMKERQIEATYRSRFDAQRRSGNALRELSEDAVRGWNIDKFARFVAVAVPRASSSNTRMTRDAAREAFADSIGYSYALSDDTEGVRPLTKIDLHNPRPGLRRWKALHDRSIKGNDWCVSEASIHFDGSLSLTMAVGGHRGATADSYLGGNQVETRTIETSVSDFMALLRKAAHATGNTEYEVHITVAWDNGASLEFTTKHYGEATFPQFTPVIASVATDVDDDEFLERVREIALDCVNQCGVQKLDIIKTEFGAADRRRSDMW